MSNDEIYEFEYADKIGGLNRHEIAQLRKMANDVEAMIFDHHPTKARRMSDKHRALIIIMEAALYKLLCDDNALETARIEAQFAKIKQMEAEPI